MSQTALLERAATDFEDDWIEVDIPSASAPAARPTAPNAAANPILAAMTASSEAMTRGVEASVSVDMDAFSAVDELDDAAIRAFFSEAD